MGYGAGRAERGEVIDPYEGLTGQARFDAYQKDGLVKSFNSQTAGSPAYSINKTNGFRSGDEISTDKGTFRYGQLRGNLGHFRQIAGPEAPKFEMPEFNFEMPDFNFEMPELPTPSASNPGALDVQGLRGKRGSLKDLRVRRGLTAGQQTSLKKGAALAGLNLPI